MYVNIDFPPNGNLSNYVQLHISPRALVYWVSSPIVSFYFKCYRIHLYYIISKRKTVFIIWQWQYVLLGGYVQLIHFCLYIVIHFSLIVTYWDFCCYSTNPKGYVFLRCNHSQAGLGWTLSCTSSSPYSGWLSSTQTIGLRGIRRVQ